jgi:rhamnosyltransferase subunit B
LRIVLATIGSLGDLHPLLALALELQSRGHDAIVATHECYRNKVQAAGFGFRPLRPDYDPTDRAWNRLAMNRWTGTVYILKGLLTALRETYDDLSNAIAGADLLISHATVLPGPLIAEKSGIPWVSVVLAPISLLSVNDPPRALPLAWMNRTMCWRPEITRAVQNLMRNITLQWCEPVRQLRRDLALGPGAHPLLEGQHSPSLSLALFSRAFAAPQPDWPESMVQTGFVFYDSETALAPDLEHFLDEGGRPVVFTLGSTAVIDPGTFFARSIEAVRTMGCRAVMLTGPGTALRGTQDIFVTAYAPFERLFARAAAVVHQGGIGTTAETLRAGCPALVIPFAHDQPDNAARVVRLGAGRTISRTRYTTDAATLELGALLGSDSYAAAAEEIGDAIRAEDGSRAAADAVLRQWNFHDSRN